jgi:hypothetical protein
MQAPGKTKYLMVPGSPGNSYIGKADGVQRFGHKVQRAHENEAMGLPPP